MNREGYLDEDWLGLEWSRWLALEPAAGDLDEVPTVAGVYRVRHADRGGLAYIGETGRSLRGRIRALARGVFDEEMPYRDPHVGAPCLWAIRQESGPAFEVSFSIPERGAEKGIRKSIEAALLASYRRAEGESPTGAFSRMILGYTASSYSKKGVRGGPLPDGETAAAASTGIPPLEWQSVNDPTAADWMGLDWSPPAQLAEIPREIPNIDGVYRIWDPDAPLPLEYIGESTSLRSRLLRHRRDRPGDLQYSYATPPSIDRKRRRLEAETDLLGAHWLAVYEPPRDQF